MSGSLALASHREMVNSHETSEQIQPQIVLSVFPPSQPSQLFPFLSLLSIVVRFKVDVFGRKLINYMSSATATTTTTTTSGQEKKNANK